MLSRPGLPPLTQSQIGAALDKLSMDVRLYPLDKIVSDLQVVLVLHQHVGVALHAYFRQRYDACVSARSVDAVNDELSRIVARLAGAHVEVDVIAEQLDIGHIAIGGNLRVSWH